MNGWEVGSHTHSVIAVCFCCCNALHGHSILFVFLIQYMVSCMFSTSGWPGAQALHGFYYCWLRQKWWVRGPPAYACINRGKPSTSCTASSLRRTGTGEGNKSARSLPSYYVPILSSRITRQNNAHRGSDN